MKQSDSKRYFLTKINLVRLHLWHMQFWSADRERRGRFSLSTELRGRTEKVVPDFLCPTSILSLIGFPCMGIPNMGTGDLTRTRTGVS